MTTALLTYVDGRVEAVDIPEGVSDWRVPTLHQTTQSYMYPANIYTYPTLGYRTFILHGVDVSTGFRVFYEEHKLLVEKPSRSTEAIEALDYEMSKHKIMSKIIEEE